jgi:hypothetical protein
MLRWDSTPARGWSQQKGTKMDRTKYVPEQDSTEGQTKLARELGTVVLVVGEGDCKCGCGDKTARPTSNFRPGHDAKLRGKLGRAHAAGVNVTTIHGDEQQTRAPLEVAADFGTEWVEQLQRAADKRTAKLERAAAKAEQDDAPPATDSAATTLVGQTARFKVGRWPHAGEIVTAAIDGTLDIEYTDGKGEKHTVTKNAADVEVVS